MSTVTTLTISKNSKESLVITFDFSKLLAVGETILSAEISADVSYGEDTTNDFSALLDGNPQISENKFNILQRFSGGKVNCGYRITVQATTDAEHDNIFVQNCIILIQD